MRIDEEDGLAAPDRRLTIHFSADAVLPYWPRYARTQRSFTPLLVEVYPRGWFTDYETISVPMPL